MFFHEHAAAAGTAAQATVFGTSRFEDGQTGHVLQRCTRCFILAVVASQVARVVIRDGLRGELRAIYLQTSGVYELLDELRVVDDLSIESILRILVLETVKAVWAGCNDLLDIVALKGLHIGLGQHIG